MRVGAYIDGLNLYHGGRHLCGRGTPGWRWLDVPRLVELLVSRNKAWIAQQAVVHRIAYCSAMIDSVPDTQSPQPLGNVNPRGTPLHKHCEADLTTALAGTGGTPSLPMTSAHASFPRPSVNTGNQQVGSRPCMQTTIEKKAGFTRSRPV